MKGKAIAKKITGWLKINRLAVLYFVFAVLIEMMAVFAVEGNPIMRRPFIAIGLIAFISGLVLLSKSNRVRLIIYTCLLGVQAVLDLVFSVVYDMTGQYFDFGMLNLRNDAFATLESIPVNFVTFYTGMFCCILFIVYGLRSIREEGQITISKRSRVFYIGLALAGVATMGISVLTYYPRKTNRYAEMIDGKSTGAYASYGMIGNLVGEFAQTVFLKDRSKLSTKEMESFIYNNVSTPTEYFGVAKDKNVVMILAESLEWYTFLRNDKYPNALDLTDEQLQTLYPNLTKLYNESVKMTNFHSREKTDISETLSIMGSYPTDAYVNYEYSENTLPHTVPNILNEKYGKEIQSLSFHNGFKTFYNRIEAHEMFGFESLTDMYDMEEMSKAGEKEGKAPTMKNFMDEGERNLDSEMIETCKDMMFPTDKRFYTYITTITMHGVYYERNNLSEERERLLKTYVVGKTEEETAPLFDEDTLEYVLFNYMVTGLELDDALGVMLQELESRGLKDKTTIILFGDHNAYYQQLSNYTKDIFDYDTTRNYTDLYNVPLLICDSDLEPQTIDKFTCTADMVPTLLDLMGIRYYTNMYYGNSVFSEKESVLYSRAYDVFVSSGILGKSVNNIVYRNASVTDEQLRTFKTEATALVEKIKYCDYIFKQDYFGNATHLKTFREKMKEIN